LLIPQAIIGGVAFARVHQPAGIKFGFPPACVPMSTTGMGREMFVVIAILSMGWDVSL